MADIDVVPKRKTSVWLWVMLAIVILAILWVAFGNRSTAPRSGRGIDRPAATVARIAATPAGAFFSAA
jgi:bacteriorhodopsin